MTLTTSIITGRVPLPSDDHIVYAELTFTLSGFDTQGINVLLPGVAKRAILVESVMPSGFDLWRNTEGERGTYYEVMARWTVKDRDGTCDLFAKLPDIQIGASATYELTALFNASPFPLPTNTFWMSITPAEYNAAIEAVAAAAASAAAAAASEGSIVERIPKLVSFRGDGIINTIVFSGVYTNRKAFMVFIGSVFQTSIAPVGEPERFAVTNDGVNTTLTFDEPFPDGVMVHGQAQTQISIPIADPSLITMPDGSDALDLWGQSKVFASRAAAVAWRAANTPPANMQASFDGVDVRYNGGDAAASLPALLGFRPKNDVLNLLQAGSASDLAADFAGIFAEAIADAAARNWKLLVPQGNWLTNPISYDFPAAGKLDMEFAQGAKLIGPAHFQHFAGNGVLTAFTLTTWATASTDELTGMKVSASNVETVLTLGDAVNGFTRVGAVVTVGSSVTIATGETLVISSINAILKITGENGDVGLRFRGGHFDNGLMGYVGQQASGTCVSLTTIRRLEWDGAPTFENSTGKSWADPPLERRGDSGLVLANVERANVYSPLFLHQPDLGNYTTGLARGSPPETYYIDDGRFINFFGAHSFNCNTAMRTSRNGGGYGMYGASADQCSTGFLADNVSSDGLGPARNIIIQGFTGRKLGREMLDIREVDSCVINGLCVEDWGRNPDGTEVATGINGLFAFRQVKHLDATGIVIRYEEWSPVASPHPIIVFSNGRTIVDRFNARIEVPHSAVGNGSVGVNVTGALGSTSLVNMELTTINIDTPITLPADTVAEVMSARVTKIVKNGDTMVSTEKWRQAKGRVIPMTTDVPDESTGTFVPTLVFQTPNGATVTAGTGNFGKFMRRGNFITVSLSLRVNVVWGGSAPSGTARISWTAGTAPDFGEPFGRHISFWNDTNPTIAATIDLSAFRSGVNLLTLTKLNEDRTRTTFDAASFYDTTNTYFRVDMTFSYALDGVM